MSRRLLALCLLLMLLWQPAVAEFVVSDATAVPAATPVPTPSPVTRPEPFLGWPELDSEGFLPEGERAFVHVDEEAGHWAYADQRLKVHIERRVWREGKQPRVYYFISHIFFRDGEHFRAYSKDPRQPARKMDKPETIAREHKLVYAQNGDLFTWRIQKKRFPGVIIRDGRILGDQTYNKATINIPPLDELSLYADGHIEINAPGRFSAQDYLDKGALDVFAFGPTLLKDGLKDERLFSNSYRSLEPRSAIGVVAPGHFVGILVEGRNKRSNGAGLNFVASRLLEENVTEAFTLDGGQTAAMVFMGKIVMDPGTYSGYTKTRQQPDVIGIGKK